MWVYIGILLLVSVLFFALGAAIYRGRVDLIHDYHRAKVTDLPAYAKAIGRAMFIIALAMLISAVCALPGIFQNNAAVSVSILLIGMGIGIAYIIAAQKKYNGGIF